MNIERFSPSVDNLVACLCARWCKTCEAYESTFESVVNQLRQTYPHLKMAWVDVEDQADLMGDIDIENFPTLLIRTKGINQFFGVVLPHASTFQRLAENYLSSEANVPVKLNEDNTNIDMFIQRLMDESLLR